MKRRELAALALATALPRVSFAQAYPSRPVHIIVPFTPGGTTDYVTRLVANELATALGQPVVIDNKPGAGTVIGVDAAAKAPADGYTLLTVANSYTVNQTLLPRLPYRSDDLRPIAMMGLSEHVLATHPGAGFSTLAELVAHAKRNPGKLSYASFGSGTSAHLSGEMLKSKLGIDLVHVPYKGQAPALNDLLGGQVSVMFGNWPEFRGHVQSGKLVALGMATARRSVFAPDIPTLAEQGAEIESNSWQGLLAPAKTPDAVVTRLHAEVQRALQRPAVVEALSKGGIVTLPGTTERFAAFLQSETTKYAQIIRQAHISADN